MEAIVIAIISSGLLSTIITILSQRAERSKKKSSGVSAGIRQLLYMQIKSRCKKYIGRGSVSADDLEDLVVSHEIYHDQLNGNGYLDAMMKQVKELPISGK